MCRFVLASIVGLLIATTSLPAIAQSAPTAEELAAIEAQSKATIAAATAVEAQEKAKKAAADALKAAADAEVAAAKASVGSVAGQTDIKGAVTLGGDAGKAEVRLMTMRAADGAATNMIKSLKGYLGGVNQCKTIFVTGNGANASFVALSAFEVRRDLLDKQSVTVLTSFSKALKNAQEVMKDATKAEGGFKSLGLTTIGAGIEALAKVGSYFQSDFEIKGVAVDSAGDIAAALSSKLSGKSDLKVYLDGVVPMGMFAVDGVKSDLAKIQEQARALALSSAAGANFLKEMRSVAEKQKGEQKTKIEAAAAVLALTIGEVDASLKAHNDTLSALLAVDAQGGSGLVTLAQQRSVANAFREAPENACILTVSESALGSIYSQRNLWSFLGGVPVKTSAGLAVRYQLSAAATGRILASGLAPVHAGYGSMRQVARSFEANGKSN